MKWISWFQPTEDYRPLTYPPHKEILGWWCTGYRDEEATICALVDVDTEEQAQLIIKQDWPEVEEWRFCEDKENKKVSDRFSLEPWMIERGMHHD